jgi:hypothetical protein
MADQERYDPLPPVLRLPQHGWRKLSPPWRRALVVLGLASVAGLAVALGEVWEGKRAGEQARERQDRQARAARVRELREDQRPRRVPIPAGSSGRAVALAGALETAITADVRERVQAGMLEGPVRATRCTPVRIRTQLRSAFNCFTLSDRSSGQESTPGVNVGYRFRGEADLRKRRLLWCKHNPPPLHPTSFVVSVELSPECP